MSVPPNEALVTDAAYFLAHLLLCSSDIGVLFPSSHFPLFLLVTLEC